MTPTLDDGLVFYLQEISKFPYVKDYDKASREEIIKGSLKYVVAIAKKYANNTDDLLEFIQEGNIGLIKAADTRKPGSKFAHWASLHIRGAIRNYMFGADVFSIKGRHGTDKDTPVSCDTEDTEFLKDEVTFDPEQEVSMLIASPALTDKQKEVLEQRLNGFSLREIATIKGVTHQAISLVEKAAIKALAG